MVVVKLMGGLGNQMFQYAAGRGIAHDTYQTFKMEIESGFINDFYKRKYSLRHFNILENIATKSDLPRSIDVTKKNYFIARSIRFLNNRNPLGGWKILYEKNLLYDQRVYAPWDKKYLIGYWQSEKYFLNIRDILYKEFTLKYPLERKNMAVAEIMHKTNSVSVHFRRLHGISDGVVTAAHSEIYGGALTLDYYQNALKYISERITDLHIFVFSDHPEWARNNVNLPFPTYFVDHNDDEHSYEDLRLMSLCKHNIIANSSFSWWGAWLNSNIDKIVIAPKRWFRNPSLKTSDLIPVSWYSI